jgi:hypothetical protein
MVGNTTPYLFCSIHFEHSGHQQVVASAHGTFPTMTVADRRLKVFMPKDERICPNFIAGANRVRIIANRRERTYLVYPSINVIYQGSDTNYVFEHEDIIEMNKKYCWAAVVNYRGKKKLVARVVYSTADDESGITDSNSFFPIYWLADVCPTPTFDMVGGRLESQTIVHHRNIF